MQNRIRQIRQQQGLSMQKLADQVGTSKSQIDKLERGQRRLTVDWMMRISKALGVEIASLLPQEQNLQAVSQASAQSNVQAGLLSEGALENLMHAHMQKSPASQSSQAHQPWSSGFLGSPANDRGSWGIQAVPKVADIPVLGRARGGQSAFFFENGNVHEYVRRPANLNGVENAFAVYTVGESMQPRFYAGEILFINPNQPVTRDCFVVVELEDGQGLIKQFVNQDDDWLRLRQFNPAQGLEIPRGKVRHVYRIVSSAEAA